MKILTTLLCFYFAAIVSLPCQDSTEVETHCTSQDNCDNKTEGHKECQPFCNCTCGSSFIFQQLISLELSVPFKNENISAYFISESPSNFFSSFWQPPKLKL